MEESPSNAETAFVDFEDSTGIQGKQEMFDYGEDFDCGNETDTESGKNIFGENWKLRG